MITRPDFSLAIIMFANIKTCSHLGQYYYSQDRLFGLSKALPMAFTIDVKVLVYKHFLMLFGLAILVITAQLVANVFPLDLVHILEHREITGFF